MIRTPAETNQEKMKLQLLRMIDEFKICELLIAGTFHAMSSDIDQLEVTETA